MSKQVSSKTNPRTQISLSTLQGPFLSLSFSSFIPEVVHSNKNTSETSNGYCLLSIYNLFLPVQDSCYYFMYLIKNCLKMRVRVSTDGYHSTCVEAGGHLSYPVVGMEFRPSGWQQMPFPTEPSHQPSCIPSRGSHTPSAQWETEVFSKV